MFFYSYFTVHGIFVMFVCKFGGTALSDAQNVKKVIKIIKSDKARRFVVVSAMGKAFVKDRKVTDVLCDCFFELNETGNMKSWDFVANKYLSLAEKLDAPVDMRALLKNVREQILGRSIQGFRRVARRISVRKAFVGSARLPLHRGGGGRALFPRRRP